MKIVMQQISEGEEEFIIRYKEMNAELESILHFVQGQGVKLAGIKEGCDGQLFLLVPGEIYYFESVDGNIYAYLKDGVYRIREGLNEILARYEARGFFRCSRTMLVNIYKIEHLKSEPGSRILATLMNGEKVMISRKYAKELRALLKRGKESKR